LKSYCVIFNPSAKGARARAIRSNLDILGGQPVLYATAGPGDARLLGARAVKEGFETVIAAGGDGTVNEVLNGIADAPDGLKRTRFGVLPMGTANVFARELGFPFNLRKAWETLCKGKDQWIDLGLAEFGVNGSAQRRYFVQLGGAGLDSRAIELMKWELKKRLGPIAYLLAGWEALRESHPVVTVEAGSRASGELVLIGNGRLYGGPFGFFPKASLRDNLLDICVFPTVGAWRAALVAIGILSGRLHRFSSASHLSASSFTLTSPVRVALQLDGENVGELPAKISVQPAALRVIVP
jgi:YegS/Rv2252/BmrU family lipid kinase